MGTGELLGKLDEMQGGTPRWTSILSRGELLLSLWLYGQETGTTSCKRGHQAQVQTFFATNDSTSNLTGYLKNFLKFCGMLETNLVEKNMETYFHHGHGNLLISLHRRVNKKPKMLGITVLLMWMLTVQTNMLRCIYTIFPCARLKKMCNSCAFVIKCYKYCKTGKYMTDMYIWLRARKDTFLLF